MSRHFIAKVENIVHVIMRCLNQALSSIYCSDCLCQGRGDFSSSARLKDLNSSVAKATPAVR